LQNRLVHSANRATALSVNALMMDGVGISTNLIYGSMAKVNLSLAFGIGTAMCTAGLILFLLSCKVGTEAPTLR
jgi:hypothetical protein